jgi:translation initiation factor IF-2
LAEKNRVYEVARAHDLTSKALIEVLQELGVMAKSHMSVLTDEDLAVVEKHFSQLEKQGEKVHEKSPRVEVEKSKARPKRMSAREKLEAKRAEREAARKAAKTKEAESEATPAEAEAEAEAEKPSRTLPKVEMPSSPEPTESKPRLEKMQVVQPVGLPKVENKPRTTESETESAPTRPRRATKKVDLDSIAEAAAKTRAQMADDMKTKVAAPTPERPARRRGGETSGSRRAPRREAEEHQPRPIDPNAIRSSVQKALGGINVRRGPARGPQPGGRAQAPSKGRKGARHIREEKREKVARHRAREEAAYARADELRLTEFITVQELAEKLETKPQELIMKLMGLGVMATINQRLEREQVELLVADYEDLSIHWLDTSAGEDIEIEAEEGEEMPRPPVVTVMGHVDHGKTTLLDYLRSTNVTAGEAGGITQHIGAYQVDTKKGKITFLDTPGHEAFTAMRARGARVTDIVVVVVAADDKVMPQTVEALDHAKASGCPTIIAINKIDLPAADILGVKQDLMRHNVLIEEYGGEVQCVEISAKKGENVDALLEAIALQAEILELKAREEGRARATVVEARKDLGRGAVFTALVTQGTLSVGDPFVAGACDGRVRAMFDEADQPVEEAKPSRPVLVLGASDVPVAGDQMDVVPSDSEAKEIAGRRRRLHREQALHAVKKQPTLESLFDRMHAQAEAVELSLVIKGDVSGSVEAVADALMGLSNEKVTVQVIHTGVGGINNNDIMLAAASEAIVIGFNLRPDPATRSFAAEQNVEIKLYDIIYEAVADVKAAMAGLLEPIDKEVRVGSAEVRELFRVPKVGTIAGSYVLEGEIKRNCRVRVVRDQVQVYDGRVGSLKRFKEDARNVASGYECGIGIEGYDDIKVGDILEAYEIEQVAQEM